MAMLAKAKEAVEAGDHKKAQVALANLLKSDPENVEAWVLLSDIAPTGEQKDRFLQRASRLDPQHTEVLQRVQSEIEQKEPTSTLPVSDTPLDFVAQAEGNTIPSWLADQAPADLAATVPLAEPEVTEQVDTPSWLQESPDEEWMEKTIPSSGEVMWSAKDGEPAGETTETTTQVETPSASPRPAPARIQPAENTTSGNEQYLMIGLVALAVVVFLLIVYFSIQQFF